MVVLSTKMFADHGRERVDQTSDFTGNADVAESFEKPTGDAVRNEGGDSAQAAPLRFSLRTLLLVVLIVGIVLGGFWNWILLPARRRGQAQECVNNLKQIGLAIQMYHDTFQKLPEATVCDATGGPLHSWRIFVVPYMVSSPLFPCTVSQNPGMVQTIKNLHLANQ